MDPVYQYNLTVTAEAVDRNRHVNNIVYLQWMQDAAIQHYAAAGCAELTRSIGASWVVRRHQIEYLSPAFSGDAIQVRTWVVDYRKVRSLRRYRMIRARDQAVLAQGETDWVFVDASTGKPRAIPREIAEALGSCDWK
jgi:acyl-CoA thioester hydrolase